MANDRMEGTGVIAWLVVSLSAVLALCIMGIALRWAPLTATELLIAWLAVSGGGFMLLVGGYTINAYFWGDSMKRERYAAIEFERADGRIAHLRIAAGYIFTFDALEELKSKIQDPAVHWVTLPEGVQLIMRES